ncbi:MAG: PilT/PilU family type 4a pilus ATPase [Candidatus Aminicenantes bacterium]|nr:PilT/PilU family type 4a pilus ATPase [Candidatus Aminicenantes bacterium]
MYIDDLLKIAIEMEASDLHLKAGNHPQVRVAGQLVVLEKIPRLSVDDTENLAAEMMGEVQRARLQEDFDIDLAYSLPGFGRFRGSIYYQRSSIAIALRIIHFEIKTLKDLLLPDVLEKIAGYTRGLILLTGTTGSGKTTTLASIIDLINGTRHDNIITIEDPIEYLHRDRKSTISQREVGWDVKSFARGLRAALREDPDIILVGEMRDQETIETALTEAETGHLVLSTLHTLDAPETVNRIVGVFPPHQQRQIRIQLASILRAVISQRLIPRKDGAGRVPAVEVMINTPYIAECISDRDKTYQIRDAIAAGISQYGTQTFDQSVYHLYEKNLISFEQGLRYSTSPDNFKLRVQGIRSSQDLAIEDMERDMSVVNKQGTELE